MSIGLCGASGTGKTTLALTYSKYAKVEYLPSLAREVYKALGLNPSADYTFATRLKIQRAILETTEVQYRKSSKNFISDRTPLDFLAYTLADIGRTTLGDAERTEFQSYYRDCFDLTNKYFHAVVLVQPSFEIVNDGIRPACSAYAEHINSLLLGLIGDQTKAEFLGISLKKECDDLKLRAETLLSIDNAVVQKEVSTQHCESHH